MTKLEEVEKRLRNLEPLSKPSNEAAAAIGEVVLVNVIGPTGVGKSSINRRITELDPQFSVPLGFTTRAPRSNEKLKAYRHIPHTAQGLEEILQKAQAGELVQYTFHTTSGMIYGTEPQDYKTKYSVLDMMYQFVGKTHTLGFKKVVDVAIVTSARDYAKQLEQQAELINDDAEMEKRRREGILCLKWCLSNKDGISWIQNRYGRLDQTALEVISVAKNQSKPNPDNYRLGQMLLNQLESASFKSIG